MPLTIKPDVRGRAKHFGVNARLIQAVDNAEGNLLRAVQCSVPSVQTRDQALEITCRSCAHAMSDFILADPERARAFVQFWGARWAPQGAENDPTNLNANWPKNVTALWLTT